MVLSPFFHLYYYYCPATPRPRSHNVFSFTIERGFTVVFITVAASLGCTFFLLQTSDSNKVLTGPSWHLMVGTVKENKD